MRETLWRGTAALAAVFLLAAPGLVAAQTTGTVEVVVTYSGTADVERIAVTRDRTRCGTEARVERITVGPDRGLAHVVASLPGVPGGRSAKPVLEQAGCAFVPHVLVMSPGELEIRNTDDVLHSFRTHALGNPAASRAQGKGARATVKLDKPEVVRVTCDVHGWMQAWVAVTSGRAAVTDLSGLARLEQIPPGRHRIEIWHERLGRQEKEIEVRAGQKQRVLFEMRAR